MGGFRTRSGRCVVEDGEVHLESHGLRGRLGRYYKNTKLAHKQRCERSLLRFGFVILLAMYGFGQLFYEMLFGDRQFALLGVAIVVGALALLYGYLLLRKLIRRLFRGFTAERAIPTRAVESIDPRPQRLLREPHFVVRYNESGVERKRYVGVFPDEEEFERAKVLFFDEHGFAIADP